MADEHTEAEQEQTKKKTSPMVALMVLAAAGTGGFFTGTSVLAPKVVASGGSADAAQSGASRDENGTADADHGAPAASSDGHGAATGERRASDEAHFIELSNILVNPRDSRGLRFLMASVALELEDGDTRSAILPREVQARDVVISVLERHTLEELSAPGAREGVRDEIHRAIAEAFELQWLSVYIPQFVIN